ncbi:hypothetical protein [Bradyrhizobium sp. CCGUVB14]|uniref:hypothetical protein n=1 Tax=Bradyrhizobium sp. CCGUVB14 TaxID=2949628 RepID=UPI0020B19B58|nr:hypothetical protein [Bradyrhizobium sp. CCGUVB14]MCP3444859.1 hypothetical protein [Bradyrhizobium sp. CCGUVB14]
MREWIKALPLGLGLPVLIGAASVKPEDAASNIAAWAEIFGFHNLPHWLTSPNADLHVIAATCFAAAVYSFAAWGPIRKRRMGMHLWGPWVLIIGGPLLGIVWLVLVPQFELAPAKPKVAEVSAGAPMAEPANGKIDQASPPEKTETGHVSEVSPKPPDKGGNEAPAAIDIDDSKLKFSGNTVLGNIDRVVRARNKADAIVENNVFARSDAVVDLPSPTGDFSNLSNAQLRAKCLATIRVLESQQRFSDDQWRRIRGEALSLSSEIGKRAKESITVPADPEYFVFRYGRNVVVTGNQMGASAPQAAASYMKFLLSKLGT